MFFGIACDDGTCVSLAGGDDRHDAQYWFLGAVSTVVRVQGAPGSRGEAPELLFVTRSDAAFKVMHELAPATVMDSHVRRTLSAPKLPCRKHHDLVASQDWVPETYLEQSDPL